MAKVKVKAKRRGQKPDMTWAVEGEIFEVDEGQVSRLWMTKVEAPKKAPASSKKDED